MAKMVNFTDTAGSDEHIFHIDDIKSIYVTAATTVICYVHGIDTYSGGTALSYITLTVTSGKSDEIAKKIAERMADGRGGVFTVSAASDVDITTVAHTEGT